jgi:VIT1/CCC1 family predicted Fe2+/Mn2+ transporter
MSAEALTAGWRAKVALQLIAHDALGAHARDELGLSDLRARPVQASLISAASFAAGASVPLVVSVVMSTPALMPAVAGTSSLLLAFLGAVATLVGGANLAGAAIRVLVWGALAIANSSGSRGG